MSSADPHHQRIDRILQKLEEVRARKLSCFGSESHRFHLNPSVSEKELIQFETEHRISLPSDFRSFLKLAGDGGAGPYYGIYPLEQCNECASDFGDQKLEFPLAAPCPLFPRMARDNHWKKQFEYCVSPLQGVLCIGTQGCTYLIGLIVTGEYARRVVYFDADNQPPFIVREPDFLSWYERWLDELLAETDTSWFGYGMGGTEASLLPLLADSEASDEDRHDAAYALRRLKSLSQAGQRQIVSLLTDSSPKLRAAGCYVLLKFDIEAGVRHLPALLRDKADEVRQAAISAAMHLRGEYLSERVTEMLFTDTAEVATWAYFALQNAGKLPQDTLRQLLTTTPHSNLRSSAAFGITWDASDEDQLIRLLDDEDPSVRNYASLGLRRCRTETALDALIALLDRVPQSSLEVVTIEGILHTLGEVPGTRNAEVLLKWANAENDFHRLKAIDSLCKLGDLRVAPFAQKELTTTRSPERLNSTLCVSSILSIGELVRNSLKASPNDALRQLARSPFARRGEADSWWKRWLPFR